MINVELVYLPVGKPPVHLQLTLQPKTSIKEALESSGLQEKHPEVQGMPVGIFSKRVSRDHILESGDRIEIYRPLLIDPKEKRRERARGC